MPETYEWLKPQTELPDMDGPYATFRVVRNCWWLLNSDGHICLYMGRSMQCNPHESIARKVASHNPECVGVQQIPVVFLPHRCDT